MGECLLTMDRPASAEVQLERALEIREGSAVPGPELAQTSFALARALWAGRGKRARALDLAHRARKLYETAGQESEAQTVSDWLRGRE
jgi:hypothetical protein